MLDGASRGSGPHAIVVVGEADCEAISRQGERTMNQPAPKPTEVEPGRSLYAHDLERRLLDGLAVGSGDTVVELAAGFGALCLRLAARVRPSGRTICSDIKPERVAAME